MVKDSKLHNVSNLSRIMSDVTQAGSATVDLAAVSIIIFWATNSSCLITA